MTIRTNAPEQHPIVSSRWRWASATLFATTLAMCLVPMGCAATDEYVEAPSQPSERSLSPTMETALQACVNEGVSRLSRHSYELSFEVQVNAKRVIRGVEPKGKRLGDADMETCMSQRLSSGFERDSRLPPQPIGVKISLDLPPILNSGGVWGGSPIVDWVEGKCRKRAALVGIFPDSG